MKVEAYDALGNEIVKGSFIQRVYDNQLMIVEVIEILPKNMIRCKKEEDFYIFVGEGVTLID